MWGAPASRRQCSASCRTSTIETLYSIRKPDGHAGYGAPIGCVMVSPTHIYPGPVGVDIKCSMSLLQLNIPEDALVDKAPDAYSASPRQPAAPV